MTKACHTLPFQGRSNRMSKEERKSLHKLLSHPCCHRSWRVVATWNVSTNSWKQILSGSQPEPTLSTINTNKRYVHFFNHIHKLIKQKWLKVETNRVHEVPNWVTQALSRYAQYHVEQPWSPKVGWCFRCLPKRSKLRLSFLIQILMFWQLFLQNSYT